jgi:hypothetical protein
VAAGQQFAGFVVVIDFISAEEKIVGFDAGAVLEMTPGSIVDLNYPLDVLFPRTGSMFPCDFEMHVGIGTRGRRDFGLG